MQDKLMARRRAQFTAMLALLGCAPAGAVELENFPELTADAAAQEIHSLKRARFLVGYVGVAALRTGRYVGSDERVSFPLPLVYFNYNDRLYWSIASVGGWLLRSDDRRVKFGLIAKARGGVDAEDTAFSGIVDREPSVDAGINIVWHSVPATIGLSWTADVGDRSDGQTANLRISKRVPLGAHLSMTPSLVAEWWDHKMVDYYAGVSAAETGGGAPHYVGRSSIQWRAGWSFAYRFTPQWSIGAGVSYTRLGAGLRDSPLIVRDDNTLLFLQVGWTLLHVR